MPDAAALHAFGRLLDVMARLRGPDGCPWDREQTHVTLRPYVLEEAYEVVDAIDRDDMEGLPDELGDLLLQVVFHAQLAAEGGAFTVADVATRIAAKLERRHPHVFGDATVRDAAEVARNWQHIKDREREETVRGGETLAAALGAIPRALPALVRAQKTASRLARSGFDWPTPEAILDKIEEELRELRAAMTARNPEATTAELGDLLLAAASLARRLDLSAEVALADAVTRLGTRAVTAERLARDRGTTFSELDPPAQDALWRRAKRTTI